MNSNYKYLLEKCPWWLKKNENVQAFYKAIAKLFDEIDNIYNLLEKQHLIDYANEEFLDYLGIKFNVERKNQTDNRYRNRIKLAMLKSNLVPNIDAISNIGKMFTGIVPNIELNTGDEPALYDVRFIGDKNYDFSLIDELELNNIIGGGVKVNTYKCLDAYEVGMRFGNSSFGSMKIKNEVKRTPICEFAYEKYGRFGRNKLKEQDLGEENALSIKL